MAACTCAAVADGAALARYTDGVLLVTKGGSSTREAVRKAGEMLQAAGGRLIGSAVWGLDAVGSRGGYGYGKGYGYGGYYSYADYYNAPEVEDKPRSARRTAEANGAVYIPKKNPARAVAEVAVKILGGILAVVAVLAVAALVVYFLDQAMGWGIVAGILG